MGQCLWHYFLKLIPVTGVPDLQKLALGDKKKQKKKKKKKKKNHPPELKNTLIKPTLMTTAISKSSGITLVTDLDLVSREIA